MKQGCVYKLHVVLCITHNSDSSFLSSYIRITYTAFGCKMHRINAWKQVFSCKICDFFVLSKFLF